MKLYYGHQLKSLVTEMINSPQSKMMAGRMIVRKRTSYTINDEIVDIEKLGKIIQSVNLNGRIYTLALNDMIEIQIRKRG